MSLINLIFNLKIKLFFYSSEIFQIFRLKEKNYHKKYK